MNKPNLSNGKIEWRHTRSGGSTASGSDSRLSGDGEGYTVGVSVQHGVFILEKPNQLHDPQYKRHRVFEEEDVVDVIKKYERVNPYRFQ